MCIYLIHLSMIQQTQSIDQQLKLIAIAHGYYILHIEVLIMIYDLATSLLNILGQGGCVSLNAVVA